MSLRMSLKTWSILWMLFLAFHQTLSFSLKQHCARRCLYGRGGILCNCNAVHFTGKRSSTFHPVEASPELQSRAAGRYELLMTILNRPELVDSMFSSSGENLDRNPTNSPLTESIRKSSDSPTVSDGGQTYEDQNSNGLPRELPRNGEVEFLENPTTANGPQQFVTKSYPYRLIEKGILRNSPKYKYNKLVRGLARLVKNTWQLMDKYPIDVKNQESLSRTFPIEKKADEYRSENDGDTGTPTGSAERGDGPSMDEMSQHSFSPEIINGFNNWVENLPPFHERFNGRHASDEQTDVRSEFLKTRGGNSRDLGERNDELKRRLMNRLINYLEESMAINEGHPPSLHRTKRNGASNQSQNDVPTKTAARTR